MEYIKTFEQFKTQEYTVGDTVTVKYNKNTELARIIKINSPNSYLIKLVKNNVLMPKPLEIKGENILNMMKSNDTPALSQDWITKQYQEPSNDLVINGGYPDTPVTNILT